MDIIAMVAMLLVVLRESDGAPESICYLALGSDIDLWHKISHILKSANLITIQGNYVRLTEKGIKQAESLQLILDKKEAEAKESAAMDAVGFSKPKGIVH